MAASPIWAVIRMESAGSCMLNDTFFNFNWWRATFQLIGAEAVVSLGVVVVSFISSCMWVSDSSTWLITASSLDRSTPWLCRKKRPKTPLIFIPSIKSAELTATRLKVTSSTSTFPFINGHACTRTLRLSKDKRVSGCWMTSTPRTNRLSGKRRSIRSTWICMPVALEAYAVTSRRKRFWTGGT